MRRIATSLLRPVCATRARAVLPAVHHWQQMRCMAIITVPVPKMGESITEGSIATWFKEAGDSVDADEVVTEISTDKVSVEIRSPHAGAIKDIFAKVDDTVTVGQDLFSVDTEGKGAKKQEAPKPADDKKEDKKEDKKKEASPPPPPSPKQSPPSEQPKQQAPAPPAAAAPARAQHGGKGFIPTVDHATPAQRTETRVTMSRMRLRIAERLKASQNTNAILTTFNEIDMHELINMRNSLKDEFEKKHGVKLGFMSAFVKAAANALIAEPTLNAVIDGNDVVYRNYVDISVAVSSPTGLVVPVLRDVHNMGFADIEKAVAHYGEKASKGSLAIEDMVGGTFTVSNGGIFGSLMSTPIINPPQSAVLGMHGINKRAWVVNDQIVIRPIMVVAMSYDHRLVDGREAVVFLRHIKRQIENPQTMLLGL